MTEFNFKVCNTHGIIFRHPVLINVTCLLLTCRQGASCSLDELTASAFLTVRLDRSLGGSAVQVQPV